MTAAYASSVTFIPLQWQDDAYFVKLFRELPWTHFIELIRMDDPLKRAFYEVETLANRWPRRGRIWPWPPRSDDRPGQQTPSPDV